MTNRDYLKSLSNEKLAELIGGDKICDYIETCCPDGNCTKCVENWLKTERNPDVEKGR